MDEMFVLLVILTILCLIDKVTAQCPTERYGQSCQHVCHCAQSQTCHREMGCAGRCDTDNGWDGPTCQRQNVVRGRPAVQGPLRYCENLQCFNASYVVDGITGHKIYATPCSFAESSDDKSGKAWWNVTLDQEHYIYRFTLYNRNDAAPERINGFVLSVGRSSAQGFNYKDCYRDNETGHPPAILSGTCVNNTPLKGDVIQVKQTTTEPLTMCELLVYVCAAGWYGDQCDYECSTTTTCARCDVGQLRCEECVAGRWSVHCSNTCYCLGGVSCDKTSGRCPGDECAAGYKGDTCNQTCDAGEYGPGCLSICGFCYAGRDTCNTTNGHCPDGFHRCEIGYHASTCEEECPIGQWDFDCSNSCDNCRANTGCNKASGICPQTIENLRCKPGYAESDRYCQTACPVEKWGDNCANNCSENCAFPCDKNNGVCVGGCLQGYTGENCDTECPIGQWDFNCSKSCGNCLGNTGCNKASGICPQTIDNLRCKPGYLESDLYCQTECPVAKWGDNCVNNCSVNCAFPCDNENGACIGGCLHGYTGDKCDTSISGIIGGSVAGVVVAIIISVVVVIFWRRRNVKDPSTVVSLSHVKKEESPIPKMSPNPPGAVYQNTDLHLNPISSLEPTTPSSTDHEYNTLHDYEDPTSNTYMTAKATPASVPTENVYEPVTDDAN